MNVFEKSFGPVKWNLIPLITPSSDVLMSFIPPTEVIEPENNSYTEESNTAAESTDTDSNYDSSDDDSDTPNDLVPITPFEIPDDYIYTY